MTEVVKSNNSPHMCQANVLHYLEIFLINLVALAIPQLYCYTFIQKED